MNPIVSNSRMDVLITLFAVVAMMAGAEGLHAQEPATFTVDARLGEGAPDGLQVHLRCGPAPDGEQRATQSGWLPRDGSAVFEVAVRRVEGWSCDVSAEAPPGLEVRYRGDGGSAVDIDSDGCRFSEIQAGHANFCQIEARGQTTSITVYKKWIGATREEPDVQIELVCGGQPVAGVRNINAGKPGGWALDLTDTEGILCAVVERENESFIPDSDDCRNLLILPGSEEECTLVNTKVVKMIEMLNRYGLAIMIMVFLAVGMVSRPGGSFLERRPCFAPMVAACRHGALQLLTKIYIALYLITTHTGLQNQQIGVSSVCFGVWITKNSGLAA